MGRISDVERVRRFLNDRKNNQATYRTVAKELFDGDADKAKAVIYKADQDPKQPIFMTSGGIVAYHGSEVGTSVGLYTRVEGMIKKHWGPAEGLRDITIFSTARPSTRGQGVWRQPDLVISAYPRRRSTADEPHRLHAVEVEQQNGFDIKSVYQAHAQGRDADYTWVFASLPEPHDDLDRIIDTAVELNVGLVTFERAQSFKTWTTRVIPNWKMADVADQANRQPRFAKLVGLPSVVAEGPEVVDQVLLASAT